MRGTVQLGSCRGIGKRISASLTHNGQMRKLQNLRWTFGASHSKRPGSEERQGLSFKAARGTIW